MKLVAIALEIGVIDGFKASETLLGIETFKIGMAWKDFKCFKASETLLGIETGLVSPFWLYIYRFKASETLLGIETNEKACVFVWADMLQSLWNPFRDWNIGDLRHMD